MNKAIRAALFCSVLTGMGVLFGVYASFFAREYAKEQVRASRANRKAYQDELAEIIYDDGWKKK